MYAVMLYNDDCNIILYRIDRSSEWSVDKSRHLQNRIVSTTQCVTRRIRHRKFKHFSRFHVTLSSLQYSPYSWIFFTRVWACRRTWNDETLPNTVDSRVRRSGNGGEKNISRDITLYWLGGGFVSNESDDDTVVQI